MTIFIVGPMIGQENNNIKEFQQAQKLAWQKEFECYAPPLILKKIDPKNLPDLKKSLVKLMTESDMIVTLPTWHEDSLCVDLVQIARLMEIPVNAYTYLTKN